MARLMVLGIWIAAAGVASDQARVSLTNQDVIRLLRAGFEEAVVLQAVEIHDAHFDLSPEGLAGLKKAAIGERILAAMLAKRHSQRAASSARLTLLDPGVYVKRGETYADVPTEPASWHLVPAAEQPAPDLERRVLTVRLPNSWSGLRLSGPVELLIVCSPGMSAAEYRLLRAEENDDAREFRVEAALRGGVLLGLSGGEKYNVEMEFDNNFDLGVRVRLGVLRKGEYGLIPGLMRDGRLVSTGHIHTFSVD